MLRTLTMLAIVVVGVASPVVTADLPVVEVREDNTVIRESARITITSDVIRDEDGNGVIHIIGDDLTIEFGDAALRGSPAGAEPDTYSGIGVRITGENVRINGGRFFGFKVAIHAKEAHRLNLNGADVSDNLRQRLRSTPQHEAVEDWLRPHENGNNEWMHKYGAGIYIEDSDNVIIRNVRARHVQNGIIFDNVNDSRVFDSDCSFLSGWGLAMWRSNRNTISRNAFDFCVRGYSHGVYNRGQDSAGILMFEQCSENVIVENSVTHGGDGLFSFAGREALGKVNPREDLSWYEERGNNRNIIVDNDFSYAAAHGVEKTFSFDNYILRNRFAENAITGVWGGFSQRTTIMRNTFTRNGEMPYGMERGGVNIEHGHGNIVRENVFERNACGVYLWMSPEHPLLELPWAKANHVGSTDNMVSHNTFRHESPGIQIRRTVRTALGANAFDGIDGLDSAVDIDEDSAESLTRSPHPIRFEFTWPEHRVLGLAKPVGAREELAGRDKIIMTEWGPYDWDSLLFYPHERSADRHVYRVLGLTERAHPIVGGDGIASEAVFRDDQLELRVTPLRDEPVWRNRVLPYTVHVEVGDETFATSGAVTNAEWSIRAFAWESDPREDADVWRREAENGVAFTLPHLSLRFGHGGPSDLDGMPSDVREAALAADQFGTIAETTLAFPPGRWRVRTVSDDGIRVWMDGKKVIDDWTWHSPKVHAHEFEVEQERAITLRVEHFELDGYAILTLDIEPLDE